MEPTLAWMHADRCFAIVHGCATTMKNAKVGQWVYHIDEIALLFALSRNTLQISLFFAVRGCCLIEKDVQPHIHVQFPARGGDA